MITVNDRGEFLKQLKHYLPETPWAIEIGILQGEFSEMILDRINPRLFYLIDPFIIGTEKYKDGLSTSYSTEQDYEIVKNKFAQYRSQVVIIKKFSYDVVSKFTDGLQDLIYIDASHLYEDVKRDLNDWFPKLKKGGILSGHDYIVNGDFGVIQAVDEFCKEHNLEIFLFNQNGGDWAIIK